MQRGWMVAWIPALVLGVLGAAMGRGVHRAGTQAAAESGQGSGSGQETVMVGAGDVVGCRDSRGAMATAKLIEKIPGTVFVLGDLTYDAKGFAQFQTCYEAAWGRFKERTRPAAGNHEYSDAGAGAYFRYWGEQAGPAGKGYYSYELGAWHVVVLNTNCEAVGGCGEGSPQDSWLRGDLREHRDACIVAYGHHALFSSGIFRTHAVHPELKRLWEDLYEAHADLMLAGHEHSYERFGLQDPEGRADPRRGIREIVAGTGGRSHGLLGFGVANSEVRNSDTYGVLKLELLAQGYKWEFVPIEGGTFRDSGAGNCHNREPQQARTTSAAASAAN